MAVIPLDAQPLASVGATLGEGPVWDARDGALWFVDIKSRRVHRIAEGEAPRSWDAPAEIGWVLPAEGGGFLAGLQTGLHRFDPATGAFTRVAEVEPDRPGNRLNDAAVAPDGTVWFGSMDNGELDPTGRLFSWNGAEVRASAARPAVITNGPAIAPDGRTLYAVDTLARTVAAWTIGRDGTLADERRFLAFEAGAGWPDGAICDAEGAVWQAFYGGWAARRYLPDGTQTHKVRFPVANVTKIALGGPDGRTAFATTARKGLSADALAAQPLAGDLFTFRVDVPGVAAPPVRG